MNKDIRYKWTETGAKIPMGSIYYNSVFRKAELYVVAHMMGRFYPLTNHISIAEIMLGLPDSWSAYTIDTSTGVVTFPAKTFPAKK